MAFSHLRRIRHRGLRVGHACGAIRHRGLGGRVQSNGSAPSSDSPHVLEPASISLRASNLPELAATIGSAGRYGSRLHLVGFDTPLYRAAHTGREHGMALAIN